MKSNKIAVIGGAGFLGARIAKRFDKSEKKYQVFDINIHNNPEKTIKLDVEDPVSLDHIKGSCCIINLAAIHRDDVRPISRYDDVNVQGAINVCEAARRHNIEKIIFTSSVAIYGFAPKNTDETGEPNYFNDYGRTKYLAEKVYEEWQKEDPKKRNLIIIRPTVIFGEANRGNVYNLINQIALGRFIMFGNGLNIKSIAYVENVAAFIEHSLSFKPGLHIFNYIDKPDFDMNTLIINIRKILFQKNNIGLRIPAFFGIILGNIADIISKISGRSLPISKVRVSKFLGNTQFSSSVHNTDFIAPVALVEALEKTIKYDFIENNLDKNIYYSE